MIVIVDYGVGNLGSLLNMFRRIGVEASVSSSKDDVASASGVLLPGVGAFDAGILNLQESGLVPILEEIVAGGKVPILGICLGMQLLTKGSEEGEQPGLGWVDATCVRFRPSDPRLKVPHMGWGQVSLKKKSRLFTDLPEPRFYFLHSYFILCEREDDIVGETRHENVFVSAFESGTIFGVQFHPEKSHAFGMKLFKNFADLTR